MSDNDLTSEERQELMVHRENQVTRAGRTRVDRSLVTSTQESILATLADKDYMGIHIEDADEIVAATFGFLGVVESLMGKYHKFSPQEIAIRKDINRLREEAYKFMIYASIYTRGFLGTNEKFKKAVKFTFDDLFQLMNVTGPTDMGETLKVVRTMLDEMLFLLFEGTGNFQRVKYKAAVRLEHSLLAMFGKIARLPGEEEIYEEPEEEQTGIWNKVRHTFGRDKPSKDE
ncbi:hypothetical protein KAR91_45380 [Candidatus Pacearchaeota archaeon]|nr:hypothetical protein [Candidatus Pacearchaeota archaeon]